MRGRTSGARTAQGDVPDATPAGPDEDTDEEWIARLRGAYQLPSDDEPDTDGPPRR